MTEVHRHPRITRRLIVLCPKFARFEGAEAIMERTGARARFARI